MVTCSSDALKKCAKKKEMRIKTEKIEVLQQTIYSKKGDRKVKERDNEILGFDFVFVG